MRRAITCVCVTFAVSTNPVPLWAQTPATASTSMPPPGLAHAGRFTYPPDDDLSLSSVRFGGSLVALDPGNQLSIVVRIIRLVPDSNCGSALHAVLNNYDYSSPMMKHDPSSAVDFSDGSVLTVDLDQYRSLSNAHCNMRIVEFGD